MTDRVAWILIERGWKVFAADGEEVGEVAEITGDRNIDIFNGLAVSTGLLDEDVYVPAEEIASLTEGRVELRLSQEQFSQLSPWVEPAAQLDIDAQEASLGSRIGERLDNMIESDDAQELRAGRVPVWKKLLRKIFGR